MAKYCNQAEPQMARLNDIWAFGRSRAARDCGAVGNWPRPVAKGPAAASPGRGHTASLKAAGNSSSCKFSRDDARLTASQKQAPHASTTSSGMCSTSPSSSPVSPAPRTQCIKQQASSPASAADAFHSTSLQAFSPSSRPEAQCVIPSALAA